VGPIDPASLGGRVEALAGGDAGLAVHPLGKVAVPDVARGDGDDAGLLVAHLEDDVDVLLAPAADAEEADAEVFVGAQDAVGAGGGEGHGRPGGDAGLDEVAAINWFGHGEFSVDGGLKGTAA